MTVPSAKRFVLCLLAVLAFSPGVPSAHLPVAVDGQPLPTLAPIIDKVAPAVVNIATEEEVAEDNPFRDHPFYKHFFGQSKPQQRSPKHGLGSGVILDAAKGYIVTNHHVIAKARSILVKLQDGRHFQAKVIGSDPEADLALLQIPAQGLSALVLADSERLRVGDFVVAIGNPFGLGQTVTSGIVSALGRTGLGIETYEDFIQTDASINPGNSGGALVDLRGHLVGINTAILGPSGGNIGIGFAIPANMVKEIISQLAQFGEVRRGRLGVTAQDLTPELAKAFGVQNREGVVVSEVEPGSPAAEAGLRAGDIVIRVNDAPVDNAMDMRNAVGLLRVGSRLEMEVIRDGKPLAITAEIAQRRHRTLDGGRLSPRLSGVRLGDLDEGSPYFGKLSGVVVLEVRPDSPAERAGLRKGDVIRSINQRRVQNVDELEGALGAQDKPLLLNVQRGDRAMFLLLS
jgi:serine protease Do/serine protease DegQ